MKFLKHLLLLTLIMTCVALSQDSTKSKFTNYEISLNGGMAIPYLPEEFTKLSDNGYHIGGGFGALMEPGDMGYSALYLSFGYDDFKANKDEYLLLYGLTGNQWGLSGGKVTLFTAQADFKGTFTLGGFFLNPFFQFGVGMESISSEDAVVTDGTVSYTRTGDSRSTFAWNIGAGFDVPINDSFKAYVDGRYLIGISADTRSQHFTLGAGIRFGL